MGTLHTHMGTSLQQCREETVEIRFALLKLPEIKSVIRYCFQRTIPTFIILCHIEFCNEVLQNIFNNEELHKNKLWCQIS